MPLALKPPSSCRKHGVDKMAIKKNKDGIMAAITAAAEGANSKSDTKTRAQRSLPRGTIGSVRAGLGGIQEIETDLILPWGPPDRMDPELTAVNSEGMPESIADLADSISEAGQQIPVLLRPSKNKDGYFEVIYGRRRILACRHLGIAVKALIRTLDDTEALLAKGLENSSRSELSFYERARFAAAILEQGFDRATACQALSVSKNTLSQLERVTRLVPDTVGDAIGSAPDTGRPKWMAFAMMFESGQLNEDLCHQILESCSDEMSSDERLSHVIQGASKAKQKPADKQSGVDLDDVGKMTVSTSAIKISLSKRHRDGFKSFLKGEMKDLLDRYKRSLEEK